MPRQHHQPERGEASGGGGKAVWDTGSSLYDSYELAAVRRLIDGSLAGVRSLPDEPPPPPTPAERQKDESKQQIVVASRARRGRKVTLRALFRAMASWAIRPRQEHACACVGIAPGGQVESVASSSHDAFCFPLLPSLNLSKILHDDDMNTFQQTTFCSRTMAAIEEGLLRRRFGRGRRRRATAALGAPMRRITRHRSFAAGYRGGREIVLAHELRRSLSS
ncbi:hypothetical protein EJB05_17830 [Eragrostis curvula]|uniref:Uncharacterized protein n=1 Tax=Eragrostis curvula TaxID=38414 RepID=A0A5J9VIF2_9POAL|nr:hypothetical protein EJB05_17830 [Eragrostis curvula]